MCSSFPGWSIQNVIVADEFCVRRFFGRQEVEMHCGREVLGTVGKIRHSRYPTADEFFSYLENPPQIEFIRKCITTEFAPIPQIKENDPKIGYLHTGYVAEEYPAENSLKFPNRQLEPRHHAMHCVPAAAAVSTNTVVANQIRCPNGNETPHPHADGLPNKNRFPSQTSRGLETNKGRLPNAKQLQICDGKPVMRDNRKKLPHKIWSSITSPAHTHPFSAMVDTRTVFKALPQMIK